MVNLCIFGLQFNVESRDKFKMLGGGEMSLLQTLPKVSRLNPFVACVQPTGQFLSTRQFITTLIV
jgi:hypothetical protein